MDDKLFGFNIVKNTTSDEDLEYICKIRPGVKVYKVHLYFTMTTWGNEDIHCEGFGNTEEEAKADLIEHIKFITNTLSTFRLQLENDDLNDVIKRHNS